MPGVPRATYMPYPFQIVQTPTHILMAYEFASASRTIYMNSKDESPADTWMGWSNGRWEGDTLVVDVNVVQRPDLVRPRREFPQRGVACRRALYARQPRCPSVRGHHRGSEGVHATVEDEHAALSPRREECAAPRIQVRGVCRRVDVWPSSKKEQVRPWRLHLPWWRWQRSPSAGQTQVAADSRTCHERHGATRTCRECGRLRRLRRSNDPRRLREAGADGGGSGRTGKADAQDEQPGSARWRRDRCRPRPAYNDFWWDRGTKVVPTRQTSLVVDPPDGRVPRVDAGGTEEGDGPRGARLRLMGGPKPVGTLHHARDCR